ncbi:MAG: helix-turn-helix domain-containing protein [Cyanobacteria bacterium J06638_20]
MDSEARLQNLPAYLKEYRAQRGLSQRKFAKLIGVSYGAVQTWERGIVTPETFNLERIARAAGQSLAELEAKLQSFAPEYRTATTPALYSSERWDDIVDEIHDWRNKFLAQNPELESTADAFTQHGDKMAPTLNDGDLYYVDKTDKDAQRISGGIYQISFGQKHCEVARLQNLGSTLKVSYDNNTYESLEFALDCVSSSLIIHGRVVWVGRRLK